MIPSNLLSHLIELIGNVSDAHTTALFGLTKDTLVMREHFTLSRHLNRNIAIKMGKGPIGLAAQTLKPQLLENIDSDIGGIYKRPESLKGFLALPVIAEDLLGVLIIDTKESYQISIKLQKILSNFAEQIAWHLHQEKCGAVLNDAPNLKEIIAGGICVNRSATEDRFGDSARNLQ